MKGELIWTTATPEMRNAACAAFMPPSDVNPICAWWLHADGRDWYQCLVRNREEAAKHLARVKRKKLLWASMTGLHDKYRNGATITEHHHHVRYSETPGGAWMLVEQLVTDRWQISTNCYLNAVWVDACHIQKRVEYSVRSVLPMAEAVAIVFLRANGMEVLL